MNHMAAHTRFPTPNFISRQYLYGDVISLRYFVHSKLSFWWDQAKIVRPLYPGWSLTQIIRKPYCLFLSHHTFLFTLPVFSRVCFFLLSCSFWEIELRFHSLLHVIYITILYVTLIGPIGIKDFSYPKTLSSIDMGNTITFTLLDVCI